MTGQSNEGDGTCPTPWKRAHAIEGDASRQISKMQKDGKPDAFRLRHYLCACGSWHIANRRSFNERVLDRTRRYRASPPSQAVER